MDQATTRGADREIVVVIDLPAETEYHRATLAALAHAIDAEGADLAIRVVRTPDLPAYDGEPAAIFIGPGTPYDEPEHAESAIARARREGIPLVGT